MNKKAFLIGGLAALLTFGGLAGCGDGVDQDNGISDGEQKDVVDQDTKKEAEGTLEDANNNLQEAEKNVEDALKEKGIGDGEKKDELDNTNPSK